MDTERLIGLVKNELKSGERLKWTGRPEVKIPITPGEILFTVAMLAFVAFPGSWIYGRINNNSYINTMEFICVAVLILLPLAIVIYRSLICRLLLELTIYALTNKRALILTKILWKTVITIRLNSKVGIELEKKGNDTYDIVFGKNSYTEYERNWWRLDWLSGYTRKYSDFSYSMTKAPRFAGIKNGKKIFDKLKVLMKEAVS